jgi:hypothetical protein
LLQTKVITESADIFSIQICSNCAAYLSINLIQLIIVTEIILKYAAIFFWCTSKFLIGLFTAIFMDVHPIAYFVLSISGGVTGVLFYIFVWDIITAKWRQWFPKATIDGIKINNRLRFIVKLINRYELIGIVLLTPVIISVPLGAIVCKLIENDRFKIVRLMAYSFAFWATFIYIISIIWVDEFKEFIQSYVH